MSRSYANRWPSMSVPWLGMRSPGVTTTRASWYGSLELQRAATSYSAPGWDSGRVSKMTVYRLVHNGELPAVRVGRSFRVPENAVQAYLRSSYYEADIG